MNNLVSENFFLNFKMTEHRGTTHHHLLLFLESLNCLRGVGFSSLPVNFHIQTAGHISPPPGAQINQSMFYNNLAFASLLHQVSQTKVSRFRSTYISLSRSILKQNRLQNCQINRGWISKVCLFKSSDILWHSMSLSAILLFNVYWSREHENKYKMTSLPIIHVQHA